MQILLNGETLQAPEDVTLSELLETLELEGRRFAVEINEDLVPRSRHAGHRLQPGDRVEIVQAIGGG
jgi:sulfur carrier protein